MEGNPLEQKNERVADSLLITEIPAIEEGGVVPVTREGLDRLVEPPLLEACEELYDKNIRTCMSSANSKDVGHEGHITIEFDSLSDANKEVALSFGQPYNWQGVNYVNITFPITPATTVGDIRRISRDAVSKFYKQKMIWAKGKTIEEMAAPYGSDGEGWGPENFPHNYYDAATGLYYENEEQFEKVNDLSGVEGPSSS
jgi:hypothetical protein